MQSDGTFVRTTIAMEAGKTEDTFFRPYLSPLKFFVTAGLATIQAFYASVTKRIALGIKFKPLTGHISCDGVVQAFMVDKKSATNSMIPATYAECYDDDFDLGQKRILVGEAVDNTRNVINMPCTTLLDSDNKPYLVFGANMHGLLWLGSHVLVGGQQQSIVGGPTATHPHVDTLKTDFSFPGGGEIVADAAVTGRQFKNQAIFYGSEKYYGVGENTMKLGWYGAMTWIGGSQFYIKATLRDPFSDIPASPNDSVDFVTQYFLIECYIWAAKVAPVFTNSSGEYTASLPEYAQIGRFWVLSPYLSTIAWPIIYTNPTGDRLDVFVRREATFDSMGTNYGIQGYRQDDAFDCRYSIGGGSDYLVLSKLPSPTIPSDTKTVLQGATVSLGNSYNYTYTTEYAGVDKDTQIPWICIYRETISRVDSGQEIVLRAPDGYTQVRYTPAIQMYGQDQKFVKITTSESSTLTVSSSGGNGSGSWVYKCDCLFDGNTMTMWPSTPQRPVYEFSVVSPPAVVEASYSSHASTTYETTIEYAGVVLASGSWTESWSETDSVNYHCYDGISASAWGYDGTIALLAPGTQPLSSGPFMGGSTNQVSTYDVSGTMIVYQGAKRLSNNLVEVSWDVTTLAGVNQGSLVSYHAIFSIDGLEEISTSGHVEGRVSWNPITKELLFINGPTDENYDSWC